MSTRSSSDAVDADYPIEDLGVTDPRLPNEAFEADYPDGAASRESADYQFESAAVPDDELLPPADPGRVGRAGSELPRTPGGANGSVRQRRILPKAPLSIACLGPTFGAGGVREHTLSLAQFLDPRRARITELVVTDEAAPELLVAGDTAIPVSQCSDDCLGRISRQNDVILLWGAGFNNRLGRDRPLCVFLAHGETWWTRKALEESSDVVDHVIAVSNRVRTQVCGGFPTTTILNGVAAGRLSQTCPRAETRRRFAFNPQDFVVGAVGRLTREKQFHLLIEAIGRLPEFFKLLLVGSGQRYAELLEFANHRIPGRFAIVSARHSLGDLYGAMDAFGMVSAHEGFGLVLAEAMLCGRPVFATNVGCVPEILHDRVNGLVVQDDPDSIADAILLMHEHPRWTRGMAIEGRAFASKRFHAARMARDYEDILLQLLQERRNRQQANGGRPANLSGQAP